RDRHPAEGQRPHRAPLPEHPARRLGRGLSSPRANPERRHAMSQTEPVDWQFCRDGYDITSQPLYAEQDADEVRAWNGDFCVVAVVRDPAAPQQWRINATDGGLPDDARRQTFSSPVDALDYLAARDESDSGATGQTAAVDSGDDAADCF